MNDYHLSVTAMTLVAFVLVIAAGLLVQAGGIVPFVQGLVR